MPEAQKQAITTKLEAIIKDCDNFEQWDTTDRHNFDAISQIAKDAINYINILTA